MKHKNIIKGDEVAGKNSGYAYGSLFSVQCVVCSVQCTLCNEYSADFRITPVMFGFTLFRVPLGFTGICSELTLG